MSLPGFQGREQDDETNAWEQGKGDMRLPPAPPGRRRSAMPPAGSLKPGLLLLLIAVLVALTIAVISLVAADGDGAEPDNSGDRAFAPRLPGDAEGVT